MVANKSFSAMQVFATKLLHSAKTAPILVAALLAQLLIAAAVAPSANAVAACTPTTSNSGNYTVLSFATVQSCTWTVPTGVTSVQVLIVAGGGGGGGDAGGGGGGGGYYENLAYSVTPGQSKTVTVGVGGTAGFVHASAQSAVPTGGGSSAFDVITTTGGGAGGTWNFTNVGGSGGSGGGGTQVNSSGGAISGATGANYFGYVGGTGTTTNAGSAGAGGGGGAGGVGGASTGTGVGGSGGLGKQSSITGTYYSGGGGGGSSGKTTPSPGGSGVGGQGSAQWSTSAAYLTGGASAATAGLANTGGGGGGAPYGGQDRGGGAGGSGIVVIKYFAQPTAPQAVTAVAGGESVALTWSAPSFVGSGVTYYQVEKSTDGTTYTTLSSTISSTTYSYTATGLTGGQAYYFRVAALYSGGTGAYGYPWTKIYGTQSPLFVSNTTITYQAGYGTGASDTATVLANATFTRVRYTISFTTNSLAQSADVDFLKWDTSTVSSPSFTVPQATVPNLRIPSPATAADKLTIQTNVSDLTVSASDYSLFGSALSGRLEIWPWDYGNALSSISASGSASTFDYNDSPTVNINSYGSFQVHDLTNLRTVFAWNHMGDSAAAPDLGLGNKATGEPDWTFCSTTSTCPYTANTFELDTYINMPVTALTTRTLTYDANSTQHQTGAVTGSVPNSTSYTSNTVVTVDANSGSLARQGFTFGGWNTAANGSGTTYTAGSGTFTITGSTTLYAIWSIPAAARVIGNGGSVISITNGNSVANFTYCSGSIRGNTSDGTYLYYRTNGYGGYICKATLAGVFVAVNPVTNLSGISTDSHALTYSHGCIFIRGDGSVNFSAATVPTTPVQLYCVSTTDWVMRETTIPTGKGMIAGGGWLFGNLIDFPDGRIGSVSAATATAGTGTVTAYTPGTGTLYGGTNGATTIACPSGMYCKVLRLYSPSSTGASVTLSFSEDVVLADDRTFTGAGTGWPYDDHGIATDGTYLYQINHMQGYKVWALASGSVSYLVNNASEGSLSGGSYSTGQTNCGATTGVSNTMCYIYKPTASRVTSMSNATFLGHSHLTNQYIMGDYDGASATFYLSDNTAPPAGIGSDLVAPTISSVNSSTTNGTFKIGDSISIQVNFSETVLVTGTPQLTLETGATDQSVNYDTGTGTSTLNFTYTVQSGNTNSDLDYVATTSLALNSGTITDAAGNNATLTLPSPGAANSLGNNKALNVDGVRPTFSSAAVNAAGTQLTLTYSEALSATTAATSAFSVLSAGSADTATSVTASGSTVVLALTNTIYASQVVTVAYTDPTSGDDASAVQDSAGNDAITLSATSVTNSSSTAKTTPTLSLIYPNTNRATYSSGGTVDATTATRTGDGTISYTTSASASICTVNATTGRITTTGTGSCPVTMSVAESSTYALNSTITTVTITAALSLSGTASLSNAYGIGAVDTVTATGGMGSLTFVLSTSTSNAGITMDTSTATIARLNIASTVVVGTYYDTITATDEASTSYSFAMTVTVTTAAGITITAATPSKKTYSTSGISLTNTNSATGLVNSDLVTALTYSYAALPTCASGGYCQVGDTGPGGGIVFYDAGSTQTWGRYLEVAPWDWSGSTTDPTVYWCTGGAGATTQLNTITGIGNGDTNTALMKANCAAGAAISASAYTGGGKSWYLPNYEEYAQLIAVAESVGFRYVQHSHWVSININALGAEDDATGFSYKANQTAQVHPIRAFDTTSLSYGASTGTLPSAVGTYAIIPSAATLTNGDQTSYSSITYANAVLTIGRAADSAFSTYSLLSTAVGTGFTVTAYGGSGTGAVTFYDSGSSATCTLSGAVLTNSVADYCTVIVYKQPSASYLGAQTTVTVQFLTFSDKSRQISTPAGTGSNTIVVTGGGTTWSSRATAAPSITSISPLFGPVGTTMTITGTGLNGVTIVQLTFVDLVTITGVSSTSMTAVVPAGATSGPIYVENTYGSDFNFTGFTVTG